MVYLIVDFTDGGRDYHQEMVIRGTECRETAIAAARKQLEQAGVNVRSITIFETRKDMLAVLKGMLPAGFCTTVVFDE